MDRPMANERLELTDHLLEGGAHRRLEPRFVRAGDAATSLPFADPWLELRWVLEA